MRNHDAFPQIEAKSRAAFDGFEKCGKERKVSPGMFLNNDNVITIRADKAGITKMGLDVIHNAIINN